MANKIRCKKMKSNTVIAQKAERKMLCRAADVKCVFVLHNHDNLIAYVCV